MRVLINDANILIDLVKLDMVDIFFDLEFEFNTTDFVHDELHEDQKQVLDSFVESAKFSVIETSEAEDFDGIMKLLDSSNGLSFEDCSVWYYCKKLEGVLLTGDGNLRKSARKDNVEVRGIIYIFDELLRQQKISFELAIEKMETLVLMNVRLPKAEIELRLTNWKMGVPV